MCIYICVSVCGPLRLCNSGLILVEDLEHEDVSQK